MVQPTNLPSDTWTEYSVLVDSYADFLQRKYDLDSSQYKTLYTQQNN